MITRDLSKDVHFLVAALSETLICVYEEDAASVYVPAETGYVDKYTPDHVRIRNAETGAKTYYSRDTAMFQRV